MFAKTCNSCITLFYCYIIYCGLIINSKYSEDVCYSEFCQHGYKNWHKFISIWVQGLQILYFMIVSFTDLIDSFPTVFSPRWSQCFNMTRHYLLTSLVLPLSLFTFTGFWTLYLYNRDVIYPEELDIFVPPWLNHAMHSLPVPILLGHLIINPNINPSWKSALIGLTLWFAVYGIVFVASAIQGVWAYFLFNDLDPLQRMFIIGMSYPLMVAFLVFSRCFNSHVKGIKERYVSKEVIQT